MLGTKGKSRQSVANPFELGKETVRSVKQATIHEAQESGKSFLSQLLGINLNNDNGTTVAEKPQEEAHTQPNGGKIFNFAKHQPSEKSKAIHAEKAPKRQ